ncbi:MAG: tetratricopeptide repeat protein [Bacteroidota bacterium]
MITQTILTLPFVATESGNEAQAKLGRQLSRILGQKIQSSGQVNSHFMAMRETVNEKIVFVNTTQMPNTDDLKEIAKNAKERYVLFGKVGTTNKINVEACLFDAELGKLIFHKQFETFAGYMFDTLDEITIRVLEAMQIETNIAQRIQIFKRLSDSWEAFLYFMMAEDDRYGLSVGVVPIDANLPMSGYLESLTLDPHMKDAELGLITFVIDLLQYEIIKPEEAAAKLSELVKLIPDAEHGYETLAIVKVLEGKMTEAEDVLKGALKKLPNSYAINSALAELYIENGSGDDALPIVQNLLKENLEIVQLEALIELCESQLDDLNGEQWGELQKKFLELRAARSQKEVLQSLTVIDPQRGCLN